MNKKVIWITGASSGIGKSLALKFVKEGWIVAASARREDLLQDLNKENSNILLIGKTFGHIEQSCFLKENFSITEGLPPEINLNNEKNNGESLLNLIDKDLVKSAHDVSLGGIITAISKMCIKGNKGIKLMTPKNLINKTEYLFAEDQGRYIIEINPEDLKEVSKILSKDSVHYEELGVIIDNEMIINEKTKVTIDELKSYNINWLYKYMDS